MWVSCLAFFQLVLFAGYGFVHWSSQRLSLRAQIGVQAALWLGVVLRGPLLLSQVTSDAAAAPAALVLTFLSQRVALAYFALTTTAPLLQRWYTRAMDHEPYRLYAVSNAGSMLGLLAYPFVIEPWLTLREQARAWSFGFYVYVALMLITVALVLHGERGAVREPEARAPDVTTRSAWNWLLLSAAPSALLVAISNHITVDIAATPLLWVLPLVLYLTTFIVAFARPSAHSTELYSAALIACVVALPVLLMPGMQARLPVLLGVPLATLFLGALVCHQKLAEQRPVPAQLTAYYAVIAAGGALGGGFVAFVAPWIFVDRYELPLTLLAVFALQLGFSRREDRKLAPTGAQRLAWIGFGLAAPILIATLWVQVHALGRPGTVIARTRNFFGPLQVLDTEPLRVLVHGRTDQGQALRAAGHEREPIAYYGPEAGIGRALRLHATQHPRKLGFVGLGAGALASYARAQDSVRFYEINPDIVVLARRYFQFLSGTRARTSIVVDDGRLALARDEQRFDLLVLDVFSSDAVPSHLLTVEAFTLYLQRLAPDGLLLVNVSNRYLRVERVVAGSARTHGLAYVVLESAADHARGLARSRWAIMSRDRNELTPLLYAPATKIDVPDPVAWTDDFSSLPSIVF